MNWVRSIGFLVTADLAKAESIAGLRKKTCHKPAIVSRGMVYYMKRGSRRRMLVNPGNNKLYILLSSPMPCKSRGTELYSDVFARLCH